MQSFIKIVHSVRPFSLFQNFELGTTSTDVKCHFAICWARFCNPSVLIMSIVMGMQNFIKLYQKVQEIGPVSLFSEFEPQQNLDQSQMSFDSLIGHILSISICMQNFTIVFKVQEIGPFSLFQNLELGKASTDKNVSSQSLGLDLVNINVYVKVYQNIPLSSRDGPFSLFQNLALCKTSTDDKCHFAIPWARSFQHQIVCKILSKYSKRFKSKGSLFSEFEPRQNLGQSKMSFDSLMGYILSIPMCM